MNKIISDKGRFRIGLIVLLTSSFYGINAQIKLTPSLGSSFLTNRLVSSNSSFIRSNQFWRAPYLGLDLSYTKQRSEYSIGIRSSRVGLMASYFEPTSDNKQILGRDKIAANLSLFGFSYSYLLKEVHFMKSQRFLARNPVEEIREYYSTHTKYYFNLKIQPIIGLNLVRTQRNVGWGSGSASAGYSSGDSIISFKSGAWNVGKFEGKSFYGASLLLGVKFQFFGENKDKLGLTIAYNQGVNNLIKTDFSIDLQDQNGIMKNHKGVFASKGSFLTIYASYPITLVKKKL